MCEKCEGRKNPKESKGAAMKSVIRKQRMDLSILFLEVLIESTSMFLVKLSYLSSNNVQFYKLYQIQVRVCVLQYLMWVSLDLKKKI